jgi:hypothetical protein
VRKYILHSIVAGVELSSSSKKTTMKKLLILLFSLFFLSSHSVVADDISDFSIEGISVGDSLLDYMTKEEILQAIEKNKGRYLYLKEPNKYIQIVMRKDYPTYDYITVMIQNNSSNKYVIDKNEKYTILSVRGYTKYIENFDACIQEKDEIVEVLSGMFPNTQKIDQIKKYSADPSGDSILKIYAFEFDSGASIDVYCENLEETYRIKGNFVEGLNVGLLLPEIGRWLRDKK